MIKKYLFTLLELLIVVSIISILMSILLPALRKVRSQALSSSCQSQMKQIGLAQTFYSNDNDSYYIPWDNWAWLLKEDNYMSTADIYFCPAAVSVLTSEFTGGDNNAIAKPHEATRYKYITYGYNYFYAGGDYEIVGGVGQLVANPAKMGSFKYPSRKILFSDARRRGDGSDKVGTHVIPPNTSSPFINAIFSVHRNSANIMWVDGHITLEKHGRQNYQMTGAHSFFNRGQKPLH